MSQHSHSWAYLWTNYDTKRYRHNYVHSSIHTIAKTRTPPRRDRSRDIKRRSLLGREATASLDSTLKSRDITLPTKVRLVRAMVFPVVMYGCESWTIKTAECQRIDALNCGVGEDS